MEDARESLTLSSEQLTKENLRNCLLRRQDGGSDTIYHATIDFSNTINNRRPGLILPINYWWN